MDNTERAYAKLHNAKNKTLEEKRNWLLSQVAPTAAALNEISHGGFLLELEIEGRKRMHKSCSTLLSMHKEGAQYDRQTGN